MNTQDAKQWAELFTAIVEGKTIQMLDISGRWDDIRITDYEYLEGHPSDYRIKKEPKIRYRTYQELSDWVRDCPEEHREWKYADSDTVFVVCEYAEDDANEEATDVLIRSNHGEWQKPLISVEE